MSNIGTGNTGTILRGQGSGASPKYSTATYPDAAGSSGNILTSDGTNWSSAAPATSGTITSVSGTTNRITSTGGNTPVIDISASYVGQSSITTLGTIATGVWNGTSVDLAHGGTNANLTASNGGIFYSTATAGAILAGTATAGQIIRSGASTTPSWSTATYPATAGTSGNVLTSDGTNWTSSAPAGSGLLTVSGTLTNAQIKALNATPIQIIAAPGAGIAVCIMNSACTMNYGGTNAFTAAAAQTIALAFGGSNNVGTILANPGITATTTCGGITNTVSVSFNLSAITNRAVSLWNPIATEIGGNAANNNTISYNILYRLVTIP